MQRASSAVSPDTNTPAGLVSDFGLHVMPTSSLLVNKLPAPQTPQKHAPKDYQCATFCFDQEPKQKNTSTVDASSITVQRLRVEFHLKHLSKEI